MRSMGQGLWRRGVSEGMSLEGRMGDAGAM